MIFEHPQTKLWEWNKINVWSSRTHSGVFLLRYSLSLEEKEKHRESVVLLIDNGLASKHGRVDGEEVTETSVV